jgi:hypothetical protein
LGRGSMVYARLGGAAAKEFAASALSAASRTTIPPHGTRPRLSPRRSLRLLFFGRTHGRYRRALPRPRRKRRMRTPPLHSRVRLWFHTAAAITPYRKSTGPVWSGCRS